ncbi:MAG: D-alanyl-D-alanine carboxypeptidase/D-alanyl-D-alanine-endopeptidase [Rhodothermia bacterium]|nr:D-alanyl-D-alanine carboxypeptidase/D-alanyl-D-alanine-endopeptidase [Rhodothermia bacterium]
MTTQRFYLRLTILLALIGFTLSACSTGPRLADTGWPSANELAVASARIDSVLLAPEFVDAIWAAHVVDLQTGRPLYSRNARKNLIPASNAKLFTTAAALEHLGPDFRFETVLYADGEVRGDTLFGDVVIRGAGDPTLSDRYMDDPLAVLRSWADSLREHGISVVAGDIVGDDRLFDDQRLGLGWNWDNEQYYYSAQVSALSFYDNCVFVTATGDSMGHATTVSWEPLETSYVTVENRTRTIEFEDQRSRDNYRRRGSNHIVAASHVPEGQSITQCMTVENPAAYTAHVFKEVLHGSGIAVDGSARSFSRSDAEDGDGAFTVESAYGVAAAGGTDGALGERVAPAQDSSAKMVNGLRNQPARWSRVASYSSPPLSRIAYQVNKQSENLDAELLLRAVGAYRPPSDSTLLPGSAAAGVARVAQTLGAAGVDTSYVGQVDGSGLSRRNLLTALDITKLLRYMSRHPNRMVAESFVVSLPVGGLDGTLGSRYREGAVARHSVAAKTGTMTFISALSGYVTAQSGRTVIFSLICNNYSTPTSRVRQGQDSVVNILAGL